MKRLEFNLSPSLIGLYKESQLRFYCIKIANVAEDTNVIQIYGQSGTIIHECMEIYFECNNNNISVEGRTLAQQVYFENKWVEKKLHKLRGLNAKVLSKDLYWKAVIYANAKMEKYNIISSEEEIIFPLINDERALINIKGYIDVVCKDKDGNIIILDYKSSSSVGDFRHQGIHYVYSYWRKYGVLPKKAVFEYVKIKKVNSYKFTVKELEDYEVYLKDLAEEIIMKGHDVSKYECGDTDSIFNPHKEFCYKEKASRMNVNNFTIRIKKNKIQFDSQIFLTKPFEKLLRVIDVKYKYQVQGCEWSPRFQSGQWDGYKRFFRYDSLPLGFLNDFIDLFNDYVKYYGLRHRIKIIDERDLDITFKTFNTKFIDNDITLRYYQNDAIAKVIEKKIGILDMGVGSGKTITAAELIKQLNVRTLFVIHRNELIRQTGEAFEDYFGVEVGMMTEGQLVTNKQITIASVQTINAILNGDDDDKKKLLKTYLYNVNLLIMDECQFASDTNTYGTIGKYCMNTEYRVGLSGSPWRGDGATLELNSLLGFPIYSKSTKELEDEGYLVPTTCIFINNLNNVDAEPEDYNDAYGMFIAENETRNNLIKRVIRETRNKKYMVITKKVSHAEKLTEDIPNSVMIIGRLSKKQRIENFRKFKSGEANEMIGSQSILATGINIPNCDVIINTTAHKSDILTVQTIGRVKRKSPGKTMSYYIDFMDTGTAYFAKASKERAKVLERYGNKVVIVEADSIQK